MTALKDEIESLERQGWKALSGTDGAAFYADLMADDGLMVFPGMALDKRQSIAAISSASPWSTFELEDLHVAGAAAAAVITYRATAERAGTQPYRARMASVYLRAGNRWRLVLHQQTPDPDPA